MDDHGQLAFGSDLQLRSKNFFLPVLVVCAEFGRLYGLLEKTGQAMEAGFHLAVFSVE